MQKENSNKYWMDQKENDVKVKKKTKIEAPSDENKEKEVDKEEIIIGENEMDKIQPIIYQDPVVLKWKAQTYSKEETIRYWFGDHFKNMHRYKTREGKWKFNPNQFNRKKLMVLNPEKILKHTEKYK
jgi:hypothetical protein